MNNTTNTKHKVSGRYLNKEYLETNPGWHKDDSEWKSEQIIKLLKKNKITLSDLCEVGCGAGEVLSCLYKKDISKIADGYDVSPSAIEICKLKETGNLKYFLKDISEIKKNYDCLLCIDVFEHVEDYIGFVRSLKPLANYKVFHIPLDISIGSIVFDWMTYARKSVGHLHYFTTETALQTLEEVDIEVLDYFYTAPFLINNKKKSLKGHIINNLRRFLFLLSPAFLSKTLGGCSLIVLAR